MTAPHQSAGLGGKGRILEPLAWRQGADGDQEKPQSPAFEADLKTNFAVTRALEIVGEATKRLPTNLRGFAWLVDGFDITLLSF